MSWLNGSDILGASPQRAVLIQVPDVAALVQQQGGSAGALFQKLVPDTIEAKVFSAMADEIRQGMKDKGIAATVSVVSPAGYQKAVGGDFVRGTLAGALALALGQFLWSRYGK